MCVFYVIENYIEPFETGIWGSRNRVTFLWGGSTLSEKLEYLYFSLGYFRAILWTWYNRYFGKIFSALCVDVFPELFRIFPNFYIPWYMTKDSEVHLKNCLLIHYCSLSIWNWSMISLLYRVFAPRTGGQWIKSRCILFFRSNKTSEYSEKYCEQLTSEHFPLYNYRSSTLRGISRNIGRLLWQCSEVFYIHPVGAGLGLWFQ